MKPSVRLFPVECNLSWTTQYCCPHQMSSPHQLCWKSSDVQLQGQKDPHQMLPNQSPDPYDMGCHLREKRSPSWLSARIIQRRRVQRWTRQGGVLTRQVPASIIKKGTLQKGHLTNLVHLSQMIGVRCHPVKDRASMHWRDGGACISPQRHRTREIDKGRLLRVSSGRTKCLWAVQNRHWPDRKP